MGAGLAGPLQTGDRASPVRQTKNQPSTRPKGASPSLPSQGWGLRGHSPGPSQRPPTSPPTQPYCTHTCVFKTQPQHITPTLLQALLALQCSGETPTPAEQPLSPHCCVPPGQLSWVPAMLTGFPTSHQPPLGNQLCQAMPSPSRSPASKGTDKWLRSALRRQRPRGQGCTHRPRTSTPVLMRHQTMSPSL